MSEQSVSVTGSKKRSYVERKRDVGFIKGNSRQISCRRYSKSKIQAVDLEVQFDE
jgi:hypothetical protein